jgi:hypothetical protein
MNIWQIMCCAYLVLSAISLVIVLACCVAAGRADDIAEKRDGIRRS